MTPDEPDVEASLAVLHNIDTGTDTRYGATPNDRTRFTTQTVLPEASILFLRGFMPPEWLRTVGEMHRVSPEFYRRHLQHKAFSSGGRELYTSPGLPSSSTRIFQLTIPTICARNTGGSGNEPEDLQEARRLESEAFSKYNKQLRSRAKPADSIVRRCLLLSKEEYIVEQTITIEVGPSGAKWRAVIWLDSGRDLSQSVEGPWLPRSGTRAWETYFFPVIVPQVADSNPPQGDELTSQRSIFTQTTSKLTAHSNGNPVQDWRAAQNICLLPFQYGSRLHRDLACQDALYALSELFQFAASAELQSLNLLSTRIEHELSFVGDEDVSRYHSISLLNLKYIKTQLTSVTQRLAETVSILENRNSLDWPRAEGSAVVDRTAVLLYTDFKYLLQRAETLAKECEQGMATLANSSVLDESRRSANMGMRVQRLTIIATVFIPLSFACSFWGMNFKELGNGSQPMWMYPASASPIVLLSYLLCHWSTLLKLCHRVGNHSWF